MKTRKRKQKNDISTQNIKNGTHTHTAKEAGNTFRGWPTDRRNKQYDSFHNHNKK